MPTPLTGWHSRATPYPLHFNPKLFTLRLAILCNSQLESSGFTLALFSSPAPILVDASGKILLVEDADFAGLIELTERAKSLPSTPEYRSTTWRVEQPETCQPIYIVLLPVVPPAGPESAHSYKVHRIQGHDGVTTRLEEPVGDFQDLPSVLQDLVGLGYEADKGAPEGDTDVELVQRVKGILGGTY